MDAKGGHTKWCPSHWGRSCRCAGQGDNPPITPAAIQQRAKQPITAPLHEIALAPPAAGRIDGIGIPAPSLPSAQTVLYTPDGLAAAFHETYERLAPEFGYATRPESRMPWPELPESRKALMRAVCAEILRYLP